MSATTEPGRARVDPGCAAIAAAFAKRNLKAMLPDSVTARDPMYRRAGSSFDLRSIREYQPFDDPRAIDWKLFGRTDRAYVKEFYDEAGEGVAFLVDGSASMAGADLEGFRCFVASLGYLLLSLGLGVSLWTYADGRLGPRIGARSRGDHLRLLEALDAMPLAGATGTDRAYRRLRSASALRRIVVFSDFHEPGPPPRAPASGTLFLVRFRTPFSALATRGTEVEVTDPETGAMVTVPWDAAEEAAWDRAERTRESALASGGPRSHYCRLDPGKDRAPFYWDILERLYA